VRREDAGQKDKRGEKNETELLFLLTLTLVDPVRVISILCFSAVHNAWRSWILFPRTTSGSRNAEIAGHRDGTGVMARSR
jgi:hypothetical protein